MVNNRSRRIVCIVLFVIYLCVLLYFLFFSEKMGRTLTSTEYRYNLQPFKEIRRFISHANTLGAKAIWLNIVGNIVAFIPFGLFIGPISGRRVNIWQAGVLAFDLSMIAEIFQLVFKVGSFDVDDLLLNTFGGIVGSVIYYFYCVVERKRSNGEIQE